MKKVFLSIVAIAALVALPMSVSAQTTGTISSDAKAKVIKGLTIAKDGSDLNFGTFTSPSAASSVVLTVGASSAVSRTTPGTGGLTLITAAGLNTTVSVPTFTVTGEGAATYTFTGDASVTLKDNNGAGSNTMSASLTYVDTEGATVSTHQLSGTAATVGAKAYMVNSTLSVGANQAIGSYKGTFNITVSYN